MTNTTNEINVASFKANSFDKAMANLVLAQEKAKLAKYVDLYKMSNANVKVLGAIGNSRLLIVELEMYLASVKGIA